jgi:hypothetical protein
VTQPEYVPLKAADRVRPIERLPAADAWRADRPADFTEPGMPTGRRLGNHGPDLGYGIKLARRLVDQVKLAEGETIDDAVAGCFATGTRRSSMFGRAPVIYDMQLAFRLWGFFAGAPRELIEFRMPLFQGAAHHYDAQREIADRVLPETLRLTPADVGDDLSKWRSMIRTD